LSSLFALVLPSSLFALAANNRRWRWTSRQWRLQVLRFFRRNATAAAASCCCNLPMLFFSGLLLHLFNLGLLLLMRLFFRLGRRIGLVEVRQTPYGRYNNRICNRVIPISSRPVRPLSSGHVAVALFTAQTQSLMTIPMLLFHVLFMLVPERGARARRTPKLSRLRRGDISGIKHGVVLHILLSSLTGYTVLRVTCRWCQSRAIKLLYGDGRRPRGFLRSLLPQ
ncbi:hypothetical protein Vafri_15328, partial [Volvox africanus]